MSSQRPTTYREVFKMFSERGTAKQALPIEFRRETRIHLAEYREVDGPIVFEVFLYGNRIASLFDDGTVRVSPGRFRTNTTKNRINDFLIPNGWKIVERSGEWKLYSPVTKAYEPLLENQVVKPVK